MKTMLSGANPIIFSNLKTSHPAPSIRQFAKRAKQDIEYLCRHVDEIKLDSNGRIPKPILHARKQYLKENGLWKDKTHFVHNKVMANRHLWHKDKCDENGTTNHQRLKKGKCPITHDGDQIILHHFSQEHKGLLVAMPDKFHSTHHTKLHSKTLTHDPINRSKFDHERIAFWMSEATRVSKAKNTTPKNRL